MKRILQLVLLSVFAVSAFEISKTYTEWTNGAKVPNNVRVIELYDNVADSNDSLTADSSAICGPIPVCASSTHPKYEGFYFYARPITGTTPVAEVSWAPVWGKTLADTGAFTVIDTLGTTNTVGFVSLDSVPCQAIAIKVYNYDATATTISNYMRLFFEDEKKSYSIDLN